jgi:hypothetical protein
MADWWAEEWSVGTASSRVYCGIARTEEGYAVDVFRGDTCIDSFVFNTRTDARRAADGLKTHYCDHRSPHALEEAAGAPA